MLDGANCIPHRLHSFLVVCIGVYLTAVDLSPCSAIEEHNVLVLYNADQGSLGEGYQIADYYRQARPGVYLLGLSGVDRILTGSTLETVTAENYLNILRPQILAGIAQIPDSIDVIVTTKGLPLKIDAGVRSTDSTTQLWRRYSSLESELTRIDSIASRDAMGDQFIYTGFPDLDTTPASNPYYNSNVPFERQGSDPINGDMRLAARLDGFDVQTVKDSIDRAKNVFVVPQATHIVADDDPSAATDQMVDNVPGGPGLGLVNVVNTMGYQLSYENTNEATTTADGPVVGYVSHGIADGSEGLESGYIANQLDFDIGHGAVFLTHESWNATSFRAGYTQSQGLVAQWLAAGGTGGLGHVHEPYNGADNVTNEDLLFGNMLPFASEDPGASGLTFVEAAWSATRQLSYVNTVVGDPLMKWQKWLPGDTNLDGHVEFKDFYALQGNWLESGSFEDGDFNADGMVNHSDFEILLNNWFVELGSEVPTSIASDFEVVPHLDVFSGAPRLVARLLSEANFNDDKDVDRGDLAVLQLAYGRYGLGDVDGDGDTDGRDFLAWQRHYLEYNFSADFEIDAVIGPGDLSVWQSSYNTNRGGDADGDGDTDGRDFLAWQREYNAPRSAHEFGSVTIPEPRSICFLFGLNLVVSSIRTHRRGAQSGS